MLNSEDEMKLSFILQYTSLRDILVDNELAALGDAYVNFIYSLALSKKMGKPVGAKVDSRILAEALRNAGLREFLPSRIDRHRLADAAEALIVYCWLKKVVTISECVSILESGTNPPEAFSSLLKFLSEKLKP